MFGWRGRDGRRFGNRPSAVYAVQGAEGRLTLDHVLHTRQVREDFEIVLGSPALLHAGIQQSRSAGTTPRGVPRLMWRPRPFKTRHSTVRQRPASQCASAMFVCAEEAKRSEKKSSKMLGLRGFLCLLNDLPRAPPLALPLTATFNPGLSAHTQLHSSRAA